MAEVRQIPSAVGAFEAQVIDFNKTYSAIVQNANAVRRRQIQAQQDVEKRIDVSLADKRAIRPQDSDYIEEKRQDVYNYYFQNRDNILAGGKAAGELKMKMGEFTSAINQSSSLNKRGVNLNPAWKEAMKDKNQMDDGLTEAFNLWSLPINDSKRKQGKFMRDGVEADIDEFDVPDISYFQKFDEAKDLDKVITENVKAYTPDKMTLSTNKRLGIYVDQLKELRIYDPAHQVKEVESVANSKPRAFLTHFKPQFEIYKSQPQEDRDLEFKKVIDSYRDMAGVDMTSWFAKQGGTPGIDNELELAAFKQLESHLPKVVKDVYDYRTQSILLKQFQYNLSASRFSYEKKQDEQLDLIVSRSIKSKDFNSDTWNEYYKPFTNASNSGTGNVRSAYINFSKPDENKNITVTFQTQTPMLDVDGKYVTDRAKAMEMSKREAGTNPVVAPDGIWYAQNNRNIIINQNEPESIVSAKIAKVNDLIENSISVDAAKDTWQALRNKKTLLKEAIPGAKRTPSTKASGSTINKNVQK
jgi:hypothetical protein